MASTGLHRGTLEPPARTLRTPLPYRLSYGAQANKLARVDAVSFEQFSGHQSRVAASFRRGTTFFARPRRQDRVHAGGDVVRGGPFEVAGRSERTAALGNDPLLFSTGEFRHGHGSSG